MSETFGAGVKHLALFLFKCIYILYTLVGMLQWNGAFPVDSGLTFPHKVAYLRLNPNGISEKL